MEGDEFPVSLRRSAPDFHHQRFKSFGSLQKRDSRPQLCRESPAAQILQDGFPADAHGAFHSVKLHHGMNMGFQFGGEFLHGRRRCVFLNLSENPRIPQCSARNHAATAGTFPEEGVIAFLRERSAVGDHLDIRQRLPDQTDLPEVDRTGVDRLFDPPVNVLCAISNLLQNDLMFLRVLLFCFVLYAFF